MSNPFYSRGGAITPFVLADARDVANELSAIENGFDEVFSALNENRLASVSTTNLTIGAGAKVLLIETGRAFAIGQAVTIAYTPDPTKYMSGQVTGYNAGTGVLQVEVTSEAVGSGSYADWTISLALPGSTANFLRKTGDTMSGPLVLAGDPAGASEAARKAYVDALTTATALLAKLLTVDGAGSLIDADMLDGLHANAFARRDSDVVFGIVDARSPGSGTTGGVRIRTHSDGVAFLQIVSPDAVAQCGYFAFGADGSASWNGGAGLKSGANPVYHTGNDGAGSGLDADLWRGMAPGDLLASTFGIGVSLYNMVGSRTINVAYRNTNGRPIFVAIQADGNAGWIEMSPNGSDWATLATTIDHGRVQTVVPDGWYIRVSGSPVIQAWAEIR